MVWITRDLEEISKVGVRDTGKTSELELFLLRLSRPIGRE